MMKMMVMAMVTVKMMINYNMFNIILIFRRQMYNKLRIIDTNSHFENQFSQASGTIYFMGYLEVTFGQ